MHNKRTRPARLRLASLVTALAVAVGSAVAGSGAAFAAPSASPGATVASGSDWAITQAAGGYQVSLTLDQPLPVRDDVPELFAGDLDLGPALESADGLTLTATTTDADVAKADSVFWQWSTGGDSTATGPTTLAQAQAKSLVKAQAKPQAQSAPTTETDPSTVGTGSYTVADYNFGAQSIALANLGGVRGELEGRIYLPSAKGRHPLVIFLHGRHSSCYNLTTLRGASGWPCAAGTAPILSYAGYDGAGEALAADGYTVVSISANSINANDGSLGADAGAVARGQLILDTLTMLDKANDGASVVYHDDASSADVTLDQALVAGQATSPAAESLTAAGLKGTMDFSRIGLMGHSRGGEGAVTAGVLNEGLAHPWSIKSIFALAPIDFTRATLPDVITTTLLPYCDGDVSDQQGQHFYADSRNVFDDDVLRSDIWVMGTDHDFYNTSWTPPYPGASDDWSQSNDAVCGSSATALASGSNIRLTATQQYDVGTAYLAGFFELTLGNQTQYLGMFDGSDEIPSSVASFADVRTVAQQPSSKREDITSFASTSSLISTSAAATAVVCANRYGRTVPEAVPSCTSAAVGLTSQQQPYWTPANYAPNVPLNQLTHLTWTATTGSLAVTVPKAQQNVSRFDELTVSVSPDESVTTGTDLTLTVQDSHGASWSAPLSQLNPATVNRMPGTTSTLLKKLVLQQVHVPTATLAAAGLDLKSITRVTFTGAVGADGTAGGGAYLQDLSFDSHALGTPSVQPRPTVNVNSTTVEEGDGPSTDEVAVYLSQKSRQPVTAWLTLIGSATGKAGLAMQQVTFNPGQTCQAVEVPITGDTVAGTAALTSYKIAVSDTSNGVLGSNDFGTLTVREDDALSNGGALAPPVGQQGDVCAELAAQSASAPLTVSDAKPAPGGQLTVSGAGYRSGENVDLSLGGTVIASAIAGPDGTVSFTATVPADQASGVVALTATGSGSKRVSTATLHVLGATATTLTVSPAAPAIRQAVTLTATVSGTGGGGGKVTFFDGHTMLGAASVVAGAATLKVKAGFTAGVHALTAAFSGTATAGASTSDTVTVSLKGASTTALRLDKSSYTFGDTVSGAVTVTGAAGGTAVVTSGSTRLTVAIGRNGTGRFSLPGHPAPGSYTVSASYSGTDAVLPSTSKTQRFSVAKATTTSAISVGKTTVARGKAETVTVKVAGARAGVYPTGTVVVSIAVGRSTTTKTASLTAAQKGVISLTLNTPAQKGTAIVHAGYAGDADYLKSTAPTKKVKLS